MKTQRISITIFLVIALVIILNLLAGEFFFRLDFTQDKQYTLSNATTDILKGLDEPVTVKAYFSENLPPNFSGTRKDFKDLLIEYSSRSGGNVVYEFIDPNTDEKKEQEALQSGIQPVLIDVREKDQIKQQKAYMGALLQKGDQKEVIAFVQPGGAMEYALTTAIKKIAVIDKPTIAFSQGHGEPSLSSLTQAYTALSVLYQIEEVNIDDSTAIPQNLKALAILAPTDSFSPMEIGIIDQFVRSGGKLFIGLNRVTGDFTNATGTVQSIDLERWLESLGLLVQPNFVIDVNCGAVTVQQQQGGYTFANQVQFPYLPIINQFAEHPVTKGLEQVILQFASTVNYVGDSSKKFSPLLFTSDKSGAQSAPLYFDINKQWSNQDFTSSRLTIGGVLEGNFGDNLNSRLVLISDGDFAVNGERGRSQQLNPDNVSLLVNSIDWLADDTGLIDLRTKGVTSRPLDTLEDGTKTLLKYLNFLSPVLLVIVYGLARSQYRRKQRIDRMLENW